MWKLSLEAYIFWLIIIVLLLSLLCSLILLRLLVFQTKIKSQQRLTTDPKEVSFVVISFQGSMWHQNRHNSSMASSHIMWASNEVYLQWTFQMQFNAIQNSRFWTATNIARFRGSSLDKTYSQARYADLSLRHMDSKFTTTWYYEYDCQFADLWFKKDLTRPWPGNSFASGRMTATENGNRLPRIIQTELPDGAKAPLAALKRFALLCLSCSDCTVLSHSWVCSSTLEETSILLSSLFFTVHASSQTWPSIAQGSLSSI